MNQNTKILNCLKRGQKLSSFDAFTMYRVTRLSARIHDLRNDGNEIKSNWVTAKTGIKYLEYYMEVNNEN